MVSLFLLLVLTMWVSSALVVIDPRPEYAVNNTYYLIAHLRAPFGAAAKSAMNNDSQPLSESVTEMRVHSLRYNNTDINYEDLDPFLPLEHAGIDYEHSPEYLSLRRKSITHLPFLSSNPLPDVVFNVSVGNSSTFSISYRDLYYKDVHNYTNITEYYDAVRSAMGPFLGRITDPAQMETLYLYGTAAMGWTPREFFPFHTSPSVTLPNSASSLRGGAGFAVAGILHFMDDAMQLPWARGDVYRTQQLRPQCRSPQTMSSTCSDTLGINGKIVFVESRHGQLDLLALALQRSGVIGMIAVFGSQYEHLYEVPLRLMQPSNPALVKHVHIPVIGITSRDYQFLRSLKNFPAEIPPPRYWSEPALQYIRDGIDPMQAVLNEQAERARQALERNDTEYFAFRDPRHTNKTLHEILENLFPKDASTRAQNLSEGFVNRNILPVAAIIEDSRVGGGVLATNLALQTPVPDPIRGTLDYCTYWVRDVRYREESLMIQRAYSGNGTAFWYKNLPKACQLL